ncbi:hypothetical protein ACHAXR_007400 [Thalassiosira sp. AJA248-18]
MWYMFDGEKSFNGNLSTWDVSSVTNHMYRMFRGASSFFHGDLSTWNVSSVTSMGYMLNGAISFNRDLCAWADKFSIQPILWYIFKLWMYFSRYSPVGSARTLLCFCASDCKGLSVVSLFYDIDITVYLLWFDYPDIFYDRFRSEIRAGHADL